MRVGIFSGDAASAPRERLLTQVIDSPPMAGASLAEQVATDTRLRRAGGGGQALHRRGRRPRHQGDDAADDGRARHRGARAARHRHHRRRRAALEPDGVFFSNGPGDPATAAGAGRAAARGARRRHPLLRHLLRQPDPRQGARVRHLQAEVRPPRHQPAGHGPHHRQGRGHRAQPRLRRRRAARPRHRDAVRHGLGEPRLPQRRRRRGPRGAPRRAAGRLLGAVPPRGRGRPARRRLPLRPLRRPDGGTRTPDATTEGCTPDAEARRHQERAGHRLRPDRHRPGLRVRLLRHPGLPGAARGGHPRHPGQLQPGHDHDRPRVRRRHLRRADHPGDRREDHRQGAPGRACSRPWAARPRSTAPMELHERGILEKYDCPLIGANVEAIMLGEDREKFKGVVAALRRRVGPLVHLPLDGRGARGGRRPRLPGGRAPLVHDGRPRLGLRPRRGRAAPHRRCRAAVLPGHRGAPRGVDPGLEGVRARGDARPRRQRRGRLLDREPRPDGRAHRRLDHRRPGAHPHRPRVPAAARHRHRGHPRGRRRHRRLQHPVRGQPRRRPDHRHRDEPAGLALVGAGLQGHRVPDRQDRREDGDRLHPRRGAQRHHPRDPGILRADASTTSSSRCRGSRSRSSRPPTTPSPRR